MKNNVLEYKGYHAKIEFCAEDRILYGKVEGINDLVNFESESLDGIEDEFHNAVEDYLELCKEVGKEPDKEYKGTFNVRIDKDLHKQLAILSSKNGESLNATVEKAIRQFVFGNSNKESNNHVNFFIYNNDEKSKYKNSNVSSLIANISPCLHYTERGN